MSRCLRFYFIVVDETYLGITNGVAGFGRGEDTPILHILLGTLRKLESSTNIDGVKGDQPCIRRLVHSRAKSGLGGICGTHGPSSNDALGEGGRGSGARGLRRDTAQRSGEDYRTRSEREHLELRWNGRLQWENCKERRL